VHVHDGARGEAEELVLPAALDADDRLAGDRRPRAGRHAPSKRGVQETDRGEAASLGGASKDGGRVLDLGELGHGYLATAVRLAQVVAMSVSTPRRVTAAEPRDERALAVRRTLLVILALNIFVLGVKLAVGIRTGSLSVLGAALETFLDAFNNVVGIALVRVAAQGPDEEHPYGHEKFETLGALAIVGFLSITCFELLQRGVRDIAGGGGGSSATTSDLVLVASTMLVNVLVVVYERRRGRQLASPFLIADSAHTASDIVVTLLAVGSLLLTRLGVTRADALLAIAVALIIAWSGWKILRANIPTLVDQRAVDAEELRRLVASVPGVVDVRDVRSRFTPSGLLFAELTIVVPGEVSVAEGHAVADRVEERIAAGLGAGPVTVHVEPA
jgi:cation diffusion facilitator family transporter